MFDRALEDAKNTAPKLLESVRKNIEEGLELCHSNIKELKDADANVNYSPGVTLEKQYADLLERFKKASPDELTKIRQNLNALQAKILSAQAQLLTDTKKNYKEKKLKLENTPSIQNDINEEIIKINNSTGGVTSAGSPEEIYGKAAQKTKETLEKITPKTEEIIQNIKLIKEFLNAHLIISTTQRKKDLIKNNQNTNVQDLSNTINNINNFIPWENASPDIKSKMANQRLSRPIEDHILYLEIALQKLNLTKDSKIKTSLAFLHHDLLEIETHLRKNQIKFLQKDIPDSEKNKIKTDISFIEKKLKAADEKLNNLLQLEEMKSVPSEKLSEVKTINDYLASKRGQRTIRIFPIKEHAELEEQAKKILKKEAAASSQQEANDPQSLKNKLLAQVNEGGKKQEMALNSLFRIIEQMEPEAILAFYQALKRQAATNNLSFDSEMPFDKITEAYLKLNAATLSQNINEIKKAKAAIKHPDFQKELAAVQNQIKLNPANPSQTFSDILDEIPKDPLSHVNIFSQPIPMMGLKKPNHEDIRKHMSRDLRHYRYVAPKGDSGAQAAGPLGGWYIGCYQTTDGRIHTQRFMVKRENEYNKNITESICGRLKSSLVNAEQDYSAGTYLARKSNTAATGENTYAVSIAFDGFKESHQLAGFDKRVKMAGTKKKFFDGAARKIFAAIEKMHKKQHKGLEEALIAAWWTGDKDVHTGNIGYNSLRFLSIDHAGGLEDLGLKIHPGRDGLLQNALRVFRTHPEPTYHAAEYSSEIRNGEQMATAIKRATNQMSTEKLKELINEEIDSAAYNYRDDPDVFKKFAIRSSVPEAFLQGKDIDQQAAITKEHLYNTMHARLVNLRQYGKEIELSLCFEYKKPSNTLFYKKGEFVVKDPEKLAQFIRENPNYSLGDKHHFRGESNGHALTTAYHQTHNRLKYTSGNKLEELLAREREKVFAEEDKFGIRPFLANDFKILDLRERATNYIARFNLIKEILINENVHNTNPYKGKIDELLEFLDRYKSGVTTQHLTQICDEAYNVIQRIFETLDRNNNNNAELLAKLKVYETLSGKNLDTFTIDNSAYTLAIKSAAEQLESKLTNAQFNALQRDEIIEDKKTIETVVKQLSSLADEKNETQTTIPQIQTTLANLEERLTQAPPQTKQEYLTSVHSLSKKDELSFLDQGADYFHQDRTKAQDNVHATVTTPIIENIATENTAILLDNPTAVGKAGAVMINEGGQIKLFDFENPAISFASILAKTLLHHVVMSDHSPVSEEKLREIIKENYINLLQDKNPPQLISKDNFNEFLLKNSQFNLKASSGFFKTSQADLKNTLYKTFEKEVASHHADLLSWATIWIKTLEAQGSQAKDMFLEGSSGNTEFARLFLILVCAKGEGLSNLKSANRTGYEFNITEHEIQLMRNHLAGKASSADISTLFAAQRALHIVIQKTEQHLSLPIETDLESLEISRNRYINDQTKLKALDPDGKYMQLYGDVLQKLSLKIDEINFEIAQLEPKVTATPGSGGPK